MANLRSVSDTYQKLVTLQSFMRSSREASHSQNPWENPSVGQGRVLALLKMKDGLSTKELSCLLNMRTSSLNEILAKLERAGLIERRQSEEDGRVMLTFLTPKGRAAQQSSSVEDSPFDGLFVGFSNEELETLEGLLNRIIVNVQAMMSPDSIERARQWSENLARFYADVQNSEPCSTSQVSPIPHMDMHDFGGFPSWRGQAGFGFSDASVAEDPFEVEGRSVRDTHEQVDQSETNQDDNR